jgi:ribonuclease D
MTTDAAPAEVVAPQLPLLERPKNPLVELVTSVEGLAEAVRVLGANSGPIALDAERASGFRYSTRAYLVQAQRGTSPIYLIDPVAISPEGEASVFAELAAVLAMDVWILHAATQDLGCLAELGLRPTALFDTELGGRLAAIPRVGLGSMTENLLGFRLAKEHSAVDWSVRPMHDDWLNYAALDVDVLPALMDAVAAALEEQGKAEFARQEFEALLSFAPRGPKPDRWRGMTGLHDVKDASKLAIARSLWESREQLAIKLDVSPGRLVPDSSLVAVVKNTPRSRSEMAGRKDFNGRASRTYLDTWWKALDEGVNARDLPPVRLPATGIPNHRNWANKFPDADARLNALKPAMVLVGERLNIPVENVLTPDFMRQLAWEPPQVVDEASVAAKLASLGARAWQCEAVAADFVQALKAAAVAKDSPVKTDGAVEA